MKDYLFILMGVLCIVFGGYYFVHRAPLETRIVDESAHVTQVQRIIKGQVAVEKLTTLPGYHYITVGALLTFDRIFDFPKIKTYHVRMMAVIYTASLFFIVTCLSLYLREWREKAFMILSLPVLAPYLFLGYTEVLSLVFVVSAIFLFYAKKRFLSGLVIFGALLIRQDNIVWVAMLMLLGAQSYCEYKKVTRLSVMAYAKENIWYALSILLFVLFVFVNGGVAVGDRNQHPIGIDFENVFFFLILFAIIFLPTIISYMREIRETFMRYKYIALSVTLGFLGLYLLGFQLDHSYNKNLRFLHNYLGTFFAENIVGVVIGLMVMCVSLGFLWTILRTSGDRRFTFAALYVMTFLSLISHPLMEHRYYIIPMTLIIIFLSFKSKRWFYIQLTYMMSLSFVYYWIVFIKDYFK